MDTKIILGHIYRGRNGAIHRVINLDFDPTTTDDCRPVVTKVLSGPRETTNYFTEYGYEYYAIPGRPQVDGPCDLIEDITDTYAPAP